MTHVSRVIALKHFPHLCDRCGTTPRNLSRLHVHHIDRDRTNNEISNLQLLCVSCHTRTHAEEGISQEIWAVRRAAGGKYNEPAISDDGTLRPDTYYDDPETGCRVWLMSLGNHGYGPQAMTSRGKVVRVRRELWRIHFGEASADIGPTCGNARCVALNHLRDGVTGAIAAETVAAASELSGKLALSVIARRLDTTSGTLRKYLGKANGGGYHAAALIYAGETVPDRPNGVNDRQWQIFLAARDKTLREAGEEFGISRQAVEQHVKRVLSRMESRP